MPARLSQPCRAPERRVTRHMRAKESTPLLRPSSSRLRVDVRSTTGLAAGLIAFVALTAWVVVATNKTAAYTEIGNPSTSDHNVDMTQTERLGWRKWAGNIKRIVTRCQPQDCKGHWETERSCDKSCGGGSKTERWITTEHEKCGGTCPHTNFWGKGKTQEVSCNTHACPPPPPSPPPSPFPPPLPPSPPPPPPLAPGFFLDLVNDFLSDNKRGMSARLCSDN